MLRSKRVDDRGTGSDDVAERLATDALLEFKNPRGRKTARERWKRLVQDDSGDLPMAGDRVLPRRCLAHTSVSSARRHVEASDRHEPPKTEPSERRYLERNLARDVPKRIAAAVGISRCI